ncbi:MAG: extracellular solute-binding protein [Candidatus Limiplasma sp.]|nr:extracellular solute-binding protein [Candidatus Limiplasma sp.]MEA5145039.1 extracellular solute-binding protein [Candidatus Limiplasma sp.]
MKKVTATILAIVMLLSSVAVGALAEGATGELNIYTTVSELQYNAIVGAFQAKYPGLTINATQAGAGDCKSRIIAEAGNPQGDVMFGGLVYADTLAMHDNFEQYVSVNDANLPEEFRNNTGVLTYHDAQIPCLWVNDELEKKAGVTITGYADLLDPALSGQIVSADPTESSSAWNQLQCILTDFGGWDNEAAWDYIAKLHANNLIISSGSSAVYKGVYNGEYTVGLTYEPACVQMLSEGAEGVHIVYPVEGVTSIAFGSAIIKGAKNLDNAKLFMDFLTSDECQTIYNQCGARQANANLKVDNEWIVDLSTITYNVADTEALAQNRNAIQDHWREIVK